MDDPVWLITGCSTGFGRELAEAVRGRGHRLVATARSPDAIADLAEAGRVLTCRLDVTDRASIDATVAAAMAAFGRIDVLVNNAGHGLFGCVEEVPDDRARALFDTNFFGMVDVLRAVLPVMRAQGSGRILNLTSNGGRFAFPGMGFYHATKFAAEGLSEALAQEIAAFGIKLSIIEPGGFTTDFMGRSMAMGDFMPEYGHVREFLGSLAGGYRMGEPAAAARAMIAVAEMADPPLRVALGPTAKDEILARLTTDIESYEANSGIWQDAEAG
jgi:NAD(P)-dependent dehydrogenase (short-subunit alcohol dehydrogenase family)